MFADFLVFLLPDASDNFSSYRDNQECPQSLSDGLCFGVHTKKKMSQPINDILLPKLFNEDQMRIGNIAR